MKRILVTGASGFIGARTAEGLLAQGYEVVAQGRGRSIDAALMQAGARPAYGDLAEPAFARVVCQGVDAIVHSAGLAGTWGPYEGYRVANVVATQTLLGAARDAGVRRFVNVSSPSVSLEFRDQLGVREESLPKRFSNAYARTKWEAERLVQAAHSVDFATASLRPRAVIGRGDANILPRLIRLREEGGLVQIGRGDNVVDVTAVGNLVDAVLLCLQAPAAAMGETYNISNGAPVRFWEFVDFVLSEAGFPSAPRRRVPYCAAMAAAGASELLHRALGSRREPALTRVTASVLARSMTLDISKARERLGYRPRFSTEEAVREFLAGRSSQRLKR